MLEQLRKQSVRRYEDRTTGSRQFHETARGYMPGGDTRSIAFWPPYPLYMESGTGCRITDVDGNRYIDFVNNYTSLILGHAHPAVQEAVAAQLPRGSAYASAIPVQIEMAQLLCARVPSLESSTASWTRATGTTRCLTAAAHRRLRRGESAQSTVRTATASIF